MQWVILRKLYRLWHICVFMATDLNNLKII